ncbi:MAG: SAM-dependent methyltransferase [Micavibrio sp.]|nr:SAM-dependent methyltransferase [Micavibrio sp.]|tara:strand:+ start:3062 stop:4048 length:987 start_codon:yes stop_codon:yes gene_type:complete
MLSDKIANQIRQLGPISIADFMGQVAYYYYNSKDPFGVKGDFVTAPEVSQLFGEVLGAWVADCWMKLGAPEKFLLIEYGPGRGTLMADMLRMIKHLPPCFQACHIHLIEQSSILKNIQMQTLEDYTVHWHDSLDEIDIDVPVIVIGNEFLDALPIHQYEKVGQDWFERDIKLTNEGELSIGLKPLSLKVADIQGSGVFELSPAREAIIEELSAVEGIKLFIDYGHFETSFGDTLQAVKSHEYVDILDHIGEADITSHVDFEALSMAAQGHIYPFITQGEFLQNLGIIERARKIGAEDGWQRLIDAKQMGVLFKVFCFSDKDYGLEGFV